MAEPNFPRTIGEKKAQQHSSVANNPSWLKTTYNKVISSAVDQASIASPLRAL